MGFKLGGVVCDKCGIFISYDEYRKYDKTGMYIGDDYQVPSNWEKNEEYILCDECSRTLKLKKLLKNVTNR